MRKKTILLIILIFGIIIGTIFLSGCNEQQESNNIPSWYEQDSDNDGYLNKVDDYPDNSNFHNKTEVDRLELTSSDHWESKTLSPNISKNIKDILINAFTSGGDIELELYTLVDGYSWLSWKYYYNGMWINQPHEFYYDLNENELFEKLIVKNPHSSKQFGVQVLLYAVE